MKILIALDSSTYADSVVREVASRSLPSGTEVLMMTAISPSHVWDAQSQYSAQGRRILEERSKFLQEKLKQCRVATEVVEGDARSVISQLARDWKADLIVIGSHGDTGARDSKLGSVAAAVANESPCSVEIVKVRH